MSGLMMLAIALRRMFGSDTLPDGESASKSLVAINAEKIVNIR